MARAEAPSSLPAARSSTRVSTTLKQSRVGQRLDVTRESNAQSLEEFVHECETRLDSASAASSAVWKAA